MPNQGDGETTPFVDEVVRLCLAELQFFGNGQHREYSEKAYRRVGDYWTALTKTPGNSQWSGYNGRSDVAMTSAGAVTSNKNQPWSAAFVSWVMREAGAGDAFHYSAGHDHYIRRALAAARDPATREKFIARRHTAYTPKAGDLIACERLDNVDLSYDSYAAHGWAPTHCDIVVGFVDGGTKVVTVGGNVSHSVKQKDWQVDASGRIGPHDPGEARYKTICVIECLL